MRIWIDFLTPKHLLFLTKLAERLKTMGHKVLMTTRAHREVLGLMKLKNIDAIVVGGYGHAIKDKLIASVERMRELVPIVSDFDPDLAISYSSPEAARVSFGLGIPHYSVNDSPHAIHVAKLTLPLSEKLFCPWVIPKDAWTQFGISLEKIIPYRGIDQVAWIRDFKPNANYLRQLGIPTDRDTILIRESEVFASYLLGSVESPAPTTDGLLPHLINRFQDAIFVISPRYESQIDYIRNKYKNDRVLVLDTVVDGANLIYFSRVFIGGGGTMTGEAALLGIPTISVFPKSGLYVLEYLIEKGAIFRPTSMDEMLSLIDKMLKDCDFIAEIKQRSEELLRSMEDPIDTILEHMLRGQS
ncbi:MAG: DUF354 domain-containing protein [Crenarchaeota archaeon]|nr:DUF354 domain-containing protein [Thermoproteota archaeon]